MLSSRPASGSCPRSVLLVLALLLTGVFTAATACATDGPGGNDTLRWVKPGGGAWTDAANWNPPNVPDNDNEVAVMDSISPTPYTVTLGTGLLVGGMRISKYTTLDVHTAGRFQLDGVPVSKGTVRLSGGVDMYINRPLFWSEGGTIIIGEGGATIELRMPFNVAGTLDLFKDGKLYLDGGGLNLFCSSLLEGTIERRSGNKEVVVEYAVPQNTIIAPNTVVRVTGMMDLLAHQASLINNGTLIVSGVFQGTSAGHYNSLTGTGEMVLDEGLIITGNENQGVLINEAGHTIRGCGTILANLENHGTIESDCDYSALTVTGTVGNYGAMKDRRGHLWLKGANLINRGVLTSNGGTMWIEDGAIVDSRYGGKIGAYGSPIEVGSGASATLIGGTIEGSGAGMLHNQGAITLQDVALSPSASFRTWPGATTTVTGTRFTNQGVMRVQGTVQVGSSTDYVQNGIKASTWIDGGSMSAARGLQVQSGDLRGHGTVIGAVTSGGAVSPDPSLGALTIQGDYHQLATGRLNVGFAGSNPGENSLLGVTGNASLDGSVVASAVGGYAPVPGRQYDVLSYGSLTGAFQSVEGNLTGQLSVSPLYGAGGMGLLVSGVTGVGDPQRPAALRFYGQGGPGAAFVIELPQDATVSVRAYDARGREVARLADASKPAGVYRFALSGAGASSDLPSGVYFARAIVQSGGVTETRTARVVSLR